LSGSEPTRVGLDFGTTNSALAVVRPGEAPRLARFDGSSVYRSILYVDPEAPGRNGMPPRITAGPAAIGSFLETGGRGRLLQSVKSHLGSRQFTGTTLFGRQYLVEELVATIVSELRIAAEAELGPLGASVVCGRPARFAGSSSAEDDAFAEGRLRGALRLAGFTDVVFELEPVAAAHHYRTRLDREELVLIGDFGGGTSDFSLVRVGPSVSSVLAVDGVAVAGDAFDARLVRRLVAPGLGLGSTRTTAFGSELPIPSWLYERLERWEHLSFLKTRETLELLGRLEHEAVEPSKIAALRWVVEGDLGFYLHREIEGTKRALSGASSARFAFRDGPVVLESSVARAGFEEWIDELVGRIAGCVDGLLARAGVERGDVATVFLTGGSSFVPAVRGVFAERFGEERLRGGEELTTVATGLVEG